MKDLVLLGDEALALGAVHAGVSSVYGYPGTPSTEITEYLLEYAEEHGKPFVRWCSNEKTALEEALGVSFVGKRALVTMKHVGLNVAADPFVNSALLGINGGVVLAVADDPGMHSSQNEQDTRFYADFARIICLEPRNQQEAYVMVREAFDISEKYTVPVIVRLTTRLSHSRASVMPDEPRGENELEKAANPKEWMLIPSLARKRWRNLLERQPEFLRFTEESARNDLNINGLFTDYGIITAGLGGNYYEENIADLPDMPSRLHVSVYPLPIEKIRKLADGVAKIIVIEEGYPFIEKQLQGILPQRVAISGKLDGTLPPDGELNPDNVRKALGLPEREGTRAETGTLPGRPPQLCAGCPHVDTYTALNETLKDFKQSVVTSDIGCYALGAVPPYNSIETIVCMGASIGMAKGISEAGLKPAVAVIGDSTFLHSGMTPLVDAVSCGTGMTVLIVDNETVAMTGGQETILPSSKLKPLIEGIGVDPEHICVLDAHRRSHDENVSIMKRELAYEGLSVIISVRECIESAKKRRRKEGSST